MDDADRKVAEIKLRCQKLRRQIRIALARLRRQLQDVADEPTNQWSADDSAVVAYKLADNSTELQRLTIWLHVYAAKPAQSQPDHVQLWARRLFDPKVFRQLPQEGWDAAIALTRQLGWEHKARGRVSLVEAMAKMTGMDPVELNSGLDQLELLELIERTETEVRLISGANDSTAAAAPAG